MKTIWKFPLKVTDKQHISMPNNAKILTVQVQDHVITLWAMVDSYVYKTSRTFEIFGTGHNIHEDMGIERRYIGTVQQNGFVWHVFERI